ncbi:protein MEI2-like 2 [Tripterygium wilfordii]|uniref:Protein MEI2-like 2 n=1 Tax=Tripterygium wilfordii TaxID=458696 RepID=A0A7J7DCK4_TRIWF|nr:protein MEI2-like 2 [Tripterygium wilfordii]
MKTSKLVLEFARLPLRVFVYFFIFLFRVSTWMDQNSKDSISGWSISPFANMEKVNSTVWEIPHKPMAYQASNDASLFSSSLPVLPHEKLNFTDSEDHGQSLDDSSPNLGKLNVEAEGKDELEAVEHNAIGNLLPDDEEELLAGIMDDFDFNGLPSQLEDLEEYDLFGSGGGMELDFEAQQKLSIDMSKLNISDGLSTNGIGNYTLSNGVGSVSG